MPDRFATASLLPLLMPEKNPFRLDNLLQTNHGSSFATSSDPFMTMGNCGPFAELVCAGMVGDTDEPILPLLLMKQADHYDVVQSDIWPMRNPDVDRLWQQAIERYTRLAGENPSLSPLVQLPDQGGPGQSFRQLLSLFYCGFKHVYFHPPCPVCAKPLQLCGNDRLLQGAGLQSYSRSLQRFLYCPACGETEPDAIDFYVDTLPDGELPARVKDRTALIGAFANLILAPDASAEFPCLNCPENSHCYGSENQALERIVPFSFYPFYLLCFRAPQLNAIDFLALVSGATCREIIEHRRLDYTFGRIQGIQTVEKLLDERPALMFGKDQPKHFLETLYLKLNFLGEVNRFLLNAIREHKFRDFPLSLDTIWINFPGRAQLLPLLWNFEVTLMDIGYPPANENQLGQFPPEYGTHILGTLWFYTLLVNREQTAGKVYAALFKEASSDHGHTDDFEVSAGDDATNRVFSPRNLFWQPQEVELKPEWRQLWIQALDLGRFLLRLDVEKADAFDVFRQKFILLTDSIREVMFGTAASVPIQPAVAADQNIASILAALKARWQTELKDKDQAHPPTAETQDSTEASIDDRAERDQVDPDTETAETVMLSSETLTSPQSGEPSEKKEDETLILSAEERARLLESLSGQKKEPEDDQEEITQETVILSSGPNAAEPDDNSSLDTGESEEDLPETVILSPDQRQAADTDRYSRSDSGDRNAPKAEPQAGGSLGEQSDGDRSSGSDDEDKEDDLPETVIIRPDRKKKKD